MLFAPVVLCLLVAGCDQAPPPPLTTTQDVRELSPEAAAKQRPVAITGVVTHCNPRRGDEGGDFFVQDATAGIYVQPTAEAAGLGPGDRVTVTGVTDAGSFAPCVRAEKITRAGRGDLPPAEPFNLSKDDSRWLDAQYIQAAVVVRAVETWNDFTMLRVYSGQGNGVVLVPGAENAATAAGLVNASVRVRGVCVPGFDATDRMIRNSPIIYATYLPAVQPRAWDDAAPPRAVASLVRFSPAAHPGARRVKVAGVVVAAPRDGVILVQDATGGLAVELRAGAAPPAVGRAVGAVGMVAVAGRRVTLAEAVATDLGPAAMPDPVAVGPAELARGLIWDVVVRVEGVVQNVHADSAGRQVVALAESGVRFDAYFPAAGGPPVAEVGARVAVTGVVTGPPPGGDPAPGGFAIWAAGPDVVAVLAAPPAATRWTPARVGVVAGGLGTAALLALAWVVTLRVEVRRQTAAARAAFDRERAATAELRQGQKLKAVGQLAGGIAHDFNNLLTVINGCGELLAMDIAPGGPLAPLVADIRAAGDRAAALTSQLLIFSRRHEVTATAVDLSEVVAEAVRLLARAIPANVRIASAFAAGLPPVRADHGLIHQIVLNLAVNARDAMPAGGALTISTAPGPDGFARLTVTDTGCGMDSGVRERVFEPFFTTKGVGGGTGLGLATVYGAVQSVGGRVAFRSAAGEGTTFVVEFAPAGAETQLLRVAAPPPPPPAFPLAGPPTRGVVLLVEDDDAVRGLARRVLEAEGYTVLLPADAADAARLAAAHAGPIDLLLTDVVMPGLDGPAVAAAVAAVRPGVKVLFMSGYTPDDVARRGVTADPAVFLAKPFGPRDLTAKVRTVLAG